jgi:hypothetical protein
MLLAALLCAALVVSAQPVTPAKPAPSTQGDVRQPKGVDSSGDAGAVVVPPPTDSGAVATPPKNVDPAIDDATGGVDAKNRQQTERKQQRNRKNRAK